MLPGVSVLLLATALFFTLRYLPGVGGRDHSRYDFSLKVLAPLVAAVLTFLAFDSLYYLGSTYVDESRRGAGHRLDARPMRRRVAARPAHPPRQRARAAAAAVRAALAGGRSRWRQAPGLATWAATNFVLWSPNPEYRPVLGRLCDFRPPGSFSLGFALGTVLFVGLSSRFLKDEDREWMSRAVGTILLFCRRVDGRMHDGAAAAALGAGVADVGHTARSPRRGAASAWLSTFGGGPSPARPAPADGKGMSLLSLAAKLAPPVFLALLAGALSVLTNLSCSPHIRSSDCR